MAKEKVTMTANEISDKWGRNMKNAVSDMQAGVDRVTTSPMEKAIAKKDKMKQNLMESIDNGSWENGMRKVTLSDWKTKTKSKIGERMGSGVDNAMSKRREFDSWLVNTVQAGMDKVNAMPDLTLQDNINRMTTMVQHMASNKYKTS
ncbi:MAG: hypothetical protein PVG39_27200 [Desulfobacteraceae bacterium]|jgi:hypothetical protein